MTGCWRRLAILPLLLSIAIAGCDRPEERSGLIPTAPEALVGSLLGGESVQGYTLVKDPLVPGITSALSKGSLIGFSGGQVELLGHTLIVPLGAVTKPTLFTLTVLPTGYVEVELLATTTSLLGVVVDVGSNGFLKPVPVKLTYSRATNVSDPTKLRILRIKSLLGYGKYEVLPSRVDQASRTVTADLDHFSRYTMGYPN